MTRTEIILEAIGIEIAKRRGGRVWALCPFHEDRDVGSFFVRVRGPRAGQSHCFSCKNGGGLVALVMHVRKLDLEQAKAFVKLAGQGFEPPRARVSFVERPPVMGRRRFKLPTEVLFEPLAEWVTPARRYAEGRGLTQEELDLYGIGYAVDGHKVGGRVVIPWLGAGRIVAGYSARTFCGQDPKYNTPDPDDGADRGVMFGEHLWPPVSERRVVVVTEGALNGIAVRRAFSDVPVAALGGSEIEPAHAVKLATFPLVVLLTDPDAAGAVAAASLSSMLGRYCELRRPRLPPEQDAMDVWKKHGAADLRSRLGAAVLGTA